GGQRDVVVGTPIAGRNRLETEGLIGFFINTLVLRTKIEEGWSFRELIKKEREVTLGAYSHQDVPFERVVEEMQPERDLSRTPLFQVLFEMENVPKQEGRLSGLKVSGLGVQSTPAKFDLRLLLTDAPEGLVGMMEYNTDLFDGETIRRMRDHLQRTLQIAIADLDQPMCEIRLLTEEERRE